jgi:hypothetical protein
MALDRLAEKHRCALMIPEKKMAETTALIVLATRTSMRVKPACLCEDVRLIS